MKRLCFALLPVALLAQSDQLPTSEGALDRYIEQSVRIRQEAAPALGSLYTTQSSYAELARDPRAARVGDLITVFIAEQASAISSGATSTSRSSGADSSVTRALGTLNPLGALPNLASSTTDRTLDGSGSTTRNTTLNATLTAYVAQVLPNGNLVVEGVKEVGVNDEKQTVFLRGVVRQADVRQDNSVASDRVGLMEVKINGRGVVRSAIKKPNIFYRILMGILPF